MAREYAIVLPQFWTGSTGRAIRARGRDAQLVAAYLVTSQHSNMIGLYHLPVAYLCHDVGIPEEGASKALRSLEEVGFAFYDADAEVVWVAEMARFQVIGVGPALQPKDKRCKGVANELVKFRKSPFYQPFVERYRDAFHLRDMPPAEAAPALAARAIEGDSEAPRSQEQEQEQDQEQEQEAAAARETPATDQDAQGPGEAAHPTESRANGAGAVPARAVPAPVAVDDFPHPPVEVIDEGGPSAGNPVYPLTDRFRHELALSLARTAPHPAGGGAAVFQASERALERLGVEAAVELCRQRVHEAVARRQRQPATLRFFVECVLGDELTRRSAPALAATGTDIRVGVAAPAPAERFQGGERELR
jgi:hypothetical protein